MKSCLEQETFYECERRVKLWSEREKIYLGPQFLHPDLRSGLVNSHRANAYPCVVVVRDVHNINFISFQDTAE
jgi:hypothetical protein